MLTCFRFLVFKDLQVEMENLVPKVNEDTQVFVDQPETPDELEATEHVDHLDRLDLP